LEAAGVPTICLTAAHSITASVNPPRAAFVDLPLGNTAGRPNDPEDIAAMAVFLAGSGARNITGQAFNVDGGLVMH
jgi:NAD(P)-dependent dehydrogenase (short-subunit alcohol dehydrogenase family)